MPGLTLLLVTGLATATARAELHFPRPAADVGEVRSGQPLAHRFPFVNRGPDVIEVTAVRASCGCLTPRWTQRTYQPGEEGSLLVEVNTLSQAPGTHSWQVTVSYKTADTTREATLQLAARIITEVMVQPAALTVFADRAVGHQIVLTDLRPQPLALTEVRTSSPHLKWRVDQQTREANGPWVRTIHLEVADGFPEGRHEEVVTIYTTDPMHRDLKVPVTLVKRPRQRLAATPSQVTWTAIPSQPLPSRLVLIRDTSDEEVVVDHVTADDAAFVCQWARGPNNLATVKIQVDRKRGHGGSLNSAVHVHISKPLRDIVTIPVAVLEP